MMKDFFIKMILKFMGKHYWRRGSCNQCGQCCKTITLRFPDKLLTRESEFEYLKENYPRFHHFYISGRADNGVLLFACKFLTEDNRCSVYNLRSFFCRAYPNFDTRFIKLGGKPLEGCGFYYEPITPFKEHLQSNQRLTT
jgi:hypothetical protein